MTDVLTRRWLMPFVWCALLLVGCLAMSLFEPVFRWLEPDSRDVVYARVDFLVLLGRHLLVVTIAAALATLLGVLGAIAVTRPAGREFLPLVAQVASLGQTFPPVAVLALAVPVLGFGTLPIVVALLLYGLLPIVRNTLAGIEGISPSVLEAARGMGMTGGQILRQVELPLAAPVILAGIRTSVTINIATAALGATVGSSNLGDPIISGIVNGNTAYIVQGALLIALLALAVDSVFARLSSR
ncbi:ABC transporter permease [Halomonas denitrificans]|uniref:ABC transporter permease n=2 Tax=Halomonadaceae TaxID=28256 RepID=UPI001A8D91FB|nr:MULTISPECIES: ABC transporter permease [Halomonas]MED5297403.1 ABC transporter permease [Pseudomonadota bacterium]MBN8411343.1 ABC transporter permease [Halomonas litopenaei]MBY5925962.1 ABC transporter permease [Halomonas sp. DP4Y7-2]MBY5927694.1 ABC transporter permease [Halomonas sp. DP8Y7-3]MBY5969779.1 ABC transporter permease [Halomonas denitrificans]